MAASSRTAISDLATLAAQYGCGPVKFAGAEEALYERHLLFDNIVGANEITLRERYEAVARSVRDILSQRWIQTDRTYERENPKRIYYLSIEFLLGRSLGNNITNLMLDPVAAQLIKDKNLDWTGLLEREPDPGLGNGGLGRLAACFLDSMATMQLPATGYGLRYEYGMFKQSIKDGWQEERPDHWLQHSDPWQIMRVQDAVEVKLNCSFAMTGGSLRAEVGKPSRLYGIPRDVPIVGYGGRTINSLRLWAAAAPDYFDFQEFSHGDFVGALAEKLAAETLTQSAVSRRFDQPGTGTAIHAGVLSGRMLAGRYHPTLPARQRRLELAARQGRHPAQRYASGDCGGGVDADSARRREAGMGSSLGPDAQNAGLHQPYAVARSAREVAGGVVRDGDTATPRDHF